LRCAFEANRVARVREECRLLRGESTACCAENSRLVEAAHLVVTLQEENFELHEAAEEDCEAEEIECARLRTQRDALQVENQCLEVGMDELREEHSMLQNSHVSSQEEIWRLESTLQRLQAAEEEAVTLRSDVCNLEVEGFEEKYRELSLEVEAWRTEHASTEQTAMELHFSNQTLAATLARVEQEFLGEQERCTELEHQSQRVHGDLHAAEESTVLMQRRNEHHNLLMAKERAAALQEENRRLQDRIWRLGEIEQKSAALQAEVHKLQAENRLLSIARHKGKPTPPQAVQESSFSSGRL